MKRITKKELIEQAHQYKDKVDECVRKLNSEFWNALHEVQREYGISVEHDLHNKSKVYVSSYGMVEGGYEIFAYDNGRRHCQEFNGYEGEVNLTDEENESDLRDAAKTIEDALTNALTLPGRVECEIDLKRPIPAATFMVMLDEKPSKETMEILRREYEKEFRKRKRYYEEHDMKKTKNTEFKDLNSMANESSRFGDTYTYNVQDIEWECDDESKKHLPTEVNVDVPMEVLDNGSAEVEQYLYDYLTDTYGEYCNGFTLDEEVEDFEDANESSGDFGYEYKVTHIAWDVDELEDFDDVVNAKHLPESIIVTVPEEVCALDEEEEWISDYLSDAYGFCHNGFVFNPVGEVDESSDTCYKCGEPGENYIDGRCLCDDCLKEFEDNGWKGWTIGDDETYDESMDIRKHRFVPRIDTSTKAIKSMKDKERERERRDWKERLRNGDYDDFDAEDYDDFDESTQENWHGIDGATYSDDDRGEFITYYGIDIPYEDLISQLQTVYLHEVNSEDIRFDEFDDWMAAKTSSAMIEKELSLMSDELDSYRR